MLDPYYNPNLPKHVPPALVHDCNIFCLAEPDQDYFQTVRSMLQSDLPDTFWTRNNGGHWVALRSNVIKDIGIDHETFSSKRMLVPDEQNVDTDYFVPLMSDPPDHDGYRSIVRPIFSPQRVASLEPEVAKYARELITQIKAAGECDFMRDFALQMPIVVFLRLLDLPLEDRPQLLEVAKRFLNPAGSGERREDALQDMFAYLQPKILERAGAAGDDVLSQLVNNTYKGRSLYPEEMIGICSVVLTGGLDTTASTLGFIARYLADNPEMRTELVAEPEKVENAVNEFLRRFGVVQLTRRITRDVDFHGVGLQGGDHIAFSTSMFNLDESQFDNAMKVDLRRPRPRHTTFGSGIHFCLGSFLARMEIGVFLREWLSQIPSFSVQQGDLVQVSTWADHRLRDITAGLGCISPNTLL